MSGGLGSFCVHGVDMVNWGRFPINAAGEINRKMHRRRALDLLRISAQNRFMGVGYIESLSNWQVNLFEKTTLHEQ